MYISALVSAGIDLIFLLKAAAVLCFGFGMSIMFQLLQSRAHLEPRTAQLLVLLCQPGAGGPPKAGRVTARTAEPGSPKGHPSAITLEELAGVGLPLLRSWLGISQEAVNDCFVPCFIIITIILISFSFQLPSSQPTVGKGWAVSIQLCGAELPKSLKHNTRTSFCSQDRGTYRKDAWFTGG